VKAVLLHNGKKLTINMNEGRIGNIIYFIFSLCCSSDKKPAQSQAPVPSG
jgi:hypothetical protein